MGESAGRGSVFHKMLQALKTNTKLQKRLGVGTIIFLGAWLLAHIAVAFIAAALLTGMAVHNDRQEKLAVEKHAGDMSQIDALARAMAEKKKAKKQQGKSGGGSGGDGGGDGAAGGGGGGAAKTSAKPAKQSTAKDKDADADPNLVCQVKGHTHGITAIVISDSGHLLATASQDAVRVFDAPALLAKPAV